VAPVAGDEEQHVAAWVMNSAASATQCMEIEGVVSAGKGGTRRVEVGASFTPVADAAHCPLSQLDEHPHVHKFRNSVDGHGSFPSRSIQSHTVVGLIASTLSLHVVGHRAGLDECVETVASNICNHFPASGEDTPLCDRSTFYCP
jgi:hypothetical protein